MGLQSGSSSRSCHGRNGTQSSTTVLRAMGYSGASLYKGQVCGWVLCPLYSGASLQGTSWGWVLCPLYSGASLQGTSLWMDPLSLIQWSLSTRDKLWMGPLSLIQWSLSTRGQVVDGTSVLIERLSSSQTQQKMHWEVEISGSTTCMSFGSPLFRWFTMRGSTVSCHCEGHLDISMHGKRGSTSDYYAISFRNHPKEGVYEKKKRGRKVLHMYMYV